MKKLISLGYSETFEYNFCLENGEIINIDDNEKLCQIIENLKTEIKKRKKEIDSAYQRYEFLRFLSTHSFILINSIIEKIQKNKIDEISDDDNNQLDFVLKSISNGKIEKIKLDKKNLFESKDIFRLFNDFIKKFFSLNDLNKNDLEPVFEKNKIINNKSYKSGIYRAVYVNKDISLISIYKKLTGNLPLTNTVLIIMI